MSKQCKVYDEMVLVLITRGHKNLQVPFRELREGDRVRGLEGPCFIVGEDAHKCEDPHYEGWIAYSDICSDYYPEDFGARRQTTIDDIEGV